MVERDKFVEIPRGEAEWHAQDWRRYLLALARNTPEEDYCLPHQDFPKEIELSAGWHETFDAMRRETAADGHERWGLIGSTISRDRVFISQTFVKAEKVPHIIEGFDIQAAINQAQEKGIRYCVGDIHTHPETRTKLAQLLHHSHQDENEFSALDLYALVTRKGPLSIMFLVGPPENRLVCRSKESTFVPADLDQQTFGARWSKSKKTKYETNLALAKEYGLALYSGTSAQSMSRFS